MKTSLKSAVRFVLGPLAMAAIAAAAAVVAAPPARAAVVVYQNDFNSPTGWTDQSGNGTGISFASVNSLFGAAFQQTFTVETLRIAGNANYSDPSGTGGAYALGMLSSVQNDLLALTFNVGSLGFVNVMMDFAGIGPVACPSCGGPFGFAGQTPIFDVSLYDSPLGTFSFGNPGLLLSTAAMEGNPIASTTTLTWNNRTVSLSTANNTSGWVTLMLDLRAGAGQAGYAAFDNLVVASSDTAGDLGNDPQPSPMPEPTTLALAGLALAALMRRPQRHRSAGSTGRSAM